MATNPTALVSKLWNYCSILRDDGLSYGDYVVGSRFSDVDGKEWPVYGMFHLDDLRPRSERTP